MKQVGGGVSNTFNFFESVMGRVFQTWPHTFSDEDQYNHFKSLETVRNDLVIEATGIFKWYLG